MSLPFGLRLLLFWTQLMPTMLTHLNSQLSQVSLSHPGSCRPDEYWSASHCCQLCPAGEYVTEHCRSPHTRGQCVRCEEGSYAAFPNGLESCLRCSTCFKDQEVVAECTSTSNRICQCPTGRSYRAPDSYEFCRHCSTCPTGKVVLQKCNSTADTVCGLPSEGNSTTHPAENSWHVRVIPIVFAVSIPILVVVTCCRRQGVTLSQSQACLLKRESHESGGHSLGSSQPNGTLPPTDPESGPTAPGIETTPFLQEEGPAMVPRDSTFPGPWEEPVEGIELQVVVVKEHQAAPEQALQTPARTAQGPQGCDEAAAPLSHLEEEYKETYLLKDTSQDATNRLYYEFGRNVPENNWKMLMRFVGLEENDIEICEHENPGNLREQRHQMLLRWNDRLGRDASPFRLMASMRKLELHVYLQNIINNLIAENILGRRARDPKLEQTTLARG